MHDWCGNCHVSSFFRKPVSDFLIFLEVCSMNQVKICLVSVFCCPEVLPPPKYLKYFFKM